MFNATIKSALAAIRGQKVSLQKEIEQKKRGRKFLETAPLPQADFCEAVLADIDRRADSWDEMVIHTLTPHLRNSDPVIQIPLLESNGGYARDGVVFPVNIYGIFREDIKEAVRRKIMALDWPKEIGPPRHERAPAIAKLDKQIAELEAQDAELKKQAAESGIRLED